MMESRDTKIETSWDTISEAGLFPRQKEHEVTQGHLSDLSSQKHPTESSEEVNLDSGGLHMKVAC